MGRSSKKAASVEVATATIPVIAAKRVKIGKREAEEALEKAASAKKKKESEMLVTEQKEKDKKSKKASQEPQKQTIRESSSSEDSTSSESEKEDKAEVDASSESSSDESDKEPETKKVEFQGSIVSHGSKLNGEAVNEESSSEEEDDSSDDDNEPEKSIAKRSSSEEESEDEEPMKNPDKVVDLKMKDAPSATANKNQMATKSEIKGSTTPANQNETSSTIFVGNLSFSVGQDDIAEFFKDAGEVVGVRLAVDKEGRFRGFGHVEFATPEAAQKALKLDGQVLFGRNVKLELARERGSHSPQNGKESHQKVVKVQGQTIFVKGFDPTPEENELKSSLKKHFGSCGEITRISIPKNNATGASKGIGYLDFQDHHAFSKALELNGSLLGEKALTVEAAKPKDDSRDGGWSVGRSGGKEGSSRGWRSGGRGRGGRGRGRGLGRGRGHGHANTKRQSSGNAGAGKKTVFADD